MPLVRVEIAPKVLEWVLARASARVNLQHKFPCHKEWLEGRKQPTLKQLEELAKAASIPFGYLLLPDPPKEHLPIPFFRTLDKGIAPEPSPDLIEMVQIMQQRQAWMREYLIELGHDPLPFVGSASSKDHPSAVAEKIRVTLGLPPNWASRYPTWSAALQALKDKIEDAGILLSISGIVGNNTRRKLRVEEFRGFVLVDEYAPLILVNANDAKAAQMFTLAHELAHIWLGNSAVFDLRDMQPANNTTERACDQIAAEFLVPQDILRREWSYFEDDVEPFQKLARRFKVSEIVVARRALDLGLISREEFFDFYRAYQERERQKTSDQEGGHFYAAQRVRLGRRFSEAVVRMAKEGKLLYHEAYRLTGLYGRTFERFAEYILGLGR